MPTALITGASTGIGAAFARALAAQQYDLILVARSADKLQRLSDALKLQYAIQTAVFVQDLAMPQAGEDLFNAVSAHHPAIDLLINNAGFGDYGTFAARDRQRQVDMVQLNVTTLVELTHCVLPGMRDRQQGGIINVASIAGFQPMPYLAVYAATKAFVLSFSEALWAENRDYGVTVLALCPGPTETEFFKAADFPTTMNTPQSYVSAETVVTAALKALTAKQANIVTGGLLNNVIVNLPRLFPRQVIVNLIASQFRPKH